MPIYGIGADQEGDVSGDFIRDRAVYIGWDQTDAPDLYQFLCSLKCGDVIFIKSTPIGRGWLDVKAVGLIANSEILRGGSYPIGRRVAWVSTQMERIELPAGKNNVRLNTLYEEFDPQVQTRIIQLIQQP